MMRNGYVGIGNFIRCTLGLVVTLSFLSAAAASTPIEDLRADEIIKEADFFLNQDRVEEAIPYLDAYLERMKDANNTRIRSMKQDVRFKLAEIFLRSEDHERGLRYLEKYVESRPAPQWHKAMKLWAGSLLELRNFDGCVTVVTHALAGPPTDVRQALEKTANALDAEKDPDGYEFDEYGELIQKDKTAVEEMPHPSGYPIEDLLLLNMTLGEAYIDSGRVEESLEPFRYVVEHMQDPIRKGYALMQIINALVEKGDFETLKHWIPELYRTEARFDIRVNMALIDAATVLFDAKEYDNALPLYRMVLPREEIIEHQSKRLRELKIEAGILAEDSTEEVKKVSLKDSIFGKSYGVEEEFFVERGTETATEKPQEILDLERLIDTIRTLPPYENEATYRNAYLYDELNRPWEAVHFFDRVYQRDATSDLGTRSFYEIIRLLLDPLQERVQAEKRSRTYLATEKEGLLPRQIVYLLAVFYQKNGLTEEVKNLLPILEGFVPSHQPPVRKYECELFYMQAIADMVLMEYERAEAAFQRVLIEFPQSHQEENATYWHATALLYSQEFEKALAEFEAYLQNYPMGNWVAEAIFQSGTCQFGLEKFNEAKESFTQVIRRHPDSPVYPDASNLRGDIYGSEALLDEAIQDYENAFAKANTLAQAHYSTFQMAQVYEAENRYEEILRVVNTYLTTYGDQADSAVGIFWIGKTKINQGRIDDAIQSYFDAIIEYGIDLEQNGVDSMIAELVQLSKTRLSDEQRTSLKTNLTRIQKSTDSLTLSLRLRATLAQIEGTEIELGQTLIAELPDLNHAAPPVLATISDASFERKDYSRAKEILDVFAMKFEDSEFMRPAFKLRGFELYRAGRYDAALELIAEAQGRYGTDYDVAWAQLMKGEINIQQARYEAARSNLIAVLNVTGWRGESYAEATHLLGQAEEAAGNLLKAHGWYQRVYVQYKGYAEGAWAAKAYLNSARCLKGLERTQDARNTYRAMLFDKYVNQLPQALQAQEELGETEVLEIAEKLQQETP